MLKKGAQTLVFTAPQTTFCNKICQNKFHSGVTNSGDKSVTGASPPSRINPLSKRTCISPCIKSLELHEPVKWVFFHAKGQADTAGDEVIPICVSGNTTSSGGVYPAMFFTSFEGYVFKSCFFET